MAAPHAGIRKAKPCQGVMEIPRANSPRVVAYNPRHPLNNATPNGQNRLVMRDFRFLFLVYGYVYVYEKLLPSAFRYPLR